MAKHDIFMSFSLLSRCRSDLDRPLLRGVRSPLVLRPHLKIKKKKQKKRGNFPFPHSTPASSRIPIFRKSGGGRGSHRTRDISQRKREVRRDIREKDQEEIVAICHHRRERERVDRKWKWDPATNWLLCPSISSLYLFLTEFRFLLLLSPCPLQSKKWRLPQLLPSTVIPALHHKKR